MVQAVLMVLAAVAVIAIPAAAATWWCMSDVTRRQRSQRDLATCEAIWELTPDY